MCLGHEMLCENAGINGPPTRRFHPWNAVMIFFITGNNGREPTMSFRVVRNRLGVILMQASVGEVGPASEAEHLTILVVEDEILVRMWISDCLRNEHIVVVEASSPDEAKVALRAVTGIDAVFSDVNMPSAHDGVSLALWMAVHAPHIPVVLTSGRDNAAQLAAISTCPNVTDFVPKPYDFEAVQKLLRKRALERRSKQSEV